MKNLTLKVQAKEYNQKKMTANPLRILIVEDDEDLNKAYQMIIASEGYAVSSAYNGREALELLKGGDDPDIIFLDLRMPVMDGIAFLEKFEPPKHDTTVVVFSNYDAQDEVDKAYALGAHRYVLKARAAPKELLRIITDIAREKQSNSAS